MPQSQSLQEAIDHFRRQPWCAKLIDAPGVRCSIPGSRRTRTGASRFESKDELLHASLNYDNGVPYFLTLFRDPDSTPAPRGGGSDSSSGGINDNNSIQLPIISSVSLLFDLREGVKGFNGYVHGGFLATIMDEAMGSVLVCSYEYQVRKEQEAAARRDDASGGGGGWTPPLGVADMNAIGPIVTASMNVKFRQPVSTPCTVVTTATVTRIQGRKVFFDVDVRDERGAVCASCEGLWISMAPRPQQEQQQQKPNKEASRL